jgi:hypothetical protein
VAHVLTAQASDGEDDGFGATLIGNINDGGRIHPNDARACTQFIRHVFLLQAAGDDDNNEDHALANVASGGGVLVTSPSVSALAHNFFYTNDTCQLIDILTRLLDHTQLTDGLVPLLLRCLAAVLSWRDYPRIRYKPDYIVECLASLRDNYESALAAQDEIDDGGDGGGGDGGGGDGGGGAMTAAQVLWCQDVLASANTTIDAFIAMYEASEP